MHIYTFVEILAKNKWSFLLHRRPTNDTYLNTTGKGNPHPMQSSVRFIAATASLYS